MALPKIQTNAVYRFAESVLSTAEILDAEMEERLYLALSKVPRHRFIPDIYINRVNDDISLPIGYGQATGKPSAVARMISLVSPQKRHRVLEIGTGSGYAAAILCELGCQVLSLEKIGMLSQRTRKILDNIGYQDVVVHRFDGRNGWSEQAPFEAIVVSCAMAEINDKLKYQLCEDGGRLVAPIGTDTEQVLTLIERRGNDFETIEFESVRFSEGM